ncbi:MAG: MFS transporter [Enterocloster bolteae]
MCLCFYWTAYTLFNIPYLSLGSELTTNNDEKTRASSIRQVFGTCGCFLPTPCP